MELKDYQTKALDQIKNYLQLLVKERESGNLKHASLDAWNNLGLRNYQERQNGLGQDSPSFCLKIPTGGGKTLLAVKSIGLINSNYCRKRTGLILWVVPTTQIYNQTIRSLRNRDHPYRQHLDIESGGRTQIVEKTDRFSPQDTEENLVVLMLMLPSAARESKETLKVFRDNGGYQDFFPDEDNISEQRKLLEKFPNLDTFGSELEFLGRQVKTSLGNVLRLLSPVIILDEGHKAYSQTAQETLWGFNPCMILELSATPNKGSNILVDIKGMELNREEMIKLDLHVTNKANPDWKETLLASVNYLNVISEKAREYESNTNIYIRPICLIQVERTGKDQIDSGKIHSEEVQKHLINVLGIPPEQVAIKTSEKDELKEIDDVGGLMSRDCPVRYIITKQALQEGWDCAFAYVLAILTNPSSKNALTQLVGRILRQPYARKTKIKELDESYVFCFQQRGANLLEEIRNGFGEEGLGDLSGNVVTDEAFPDGTKIGTKTSYVREKFRQAVGEIILPVFVINDNGSWRPVSYEMDILSRISIMDANLEPIFNLSLSNLEEKDTEQITTLSEDVEKLIEQKKVRKLREGGLSLDLVFLARQILDIVVNPWSAFEISEKVMSKMQENFGERMVVNNFVFIIEELRKILEKEKDRLAKEVFCRQVLEGKLKFMVIGNNFGFQMPKTVIVKTNSKPLVSSSGAPLQQSLLEFVTDEQFNETEKNVAWYLEDHEKMYFWYRNVARQDYFVQGWRKQKVYPDFLFTERATNKTTGFDKVFVVETKGVHLKNNEDTEYKKSVFDLCNNFAVEKGFEELQLSLKSKPIRFEVVYEDEWKSKLNSLLNK